VLGFTGWLSGVSFVAALNNKLDAFILARTVGATGTGVYYVGNQLAELPTNELAAPVARALYPGLASMQADADRMRRAFLKGVEALGAVGLPAAIGFALVAGDLIPFLLGEKWAPVAPVVEIITPVLGLQTIFLATQFYAMALGLTRLVFFRELFFFLVRTPIFIWASVEHGLAGAIWAIAGLGLVHVGLNLALYARASGRAFWGPLVAARRSFLAAGIMAGAIFGLRALAPGLGDAFAPASIGAEILLGASAYIGALILFWRLEGAPDGVERSGLSLARGALGRLRRA
jgi:PST family polysaccharide transporter